MAPLITHALLGASVAALSVAGVRAASPLVPAGLARLLVAAVLAVSAVVAEAILLGLFSLGGSTIALSAAALATWAAAHALLPRPALAVATELRERGAALTMRQRMLAGGLAGAGGAWIVWQLVHPALGFDAIHYHVPEMVLWVQQGTPGSVEEVLPGLPVGNYPLTTEVTVAWAMGISRSFVPIVLWPWLTFALSGVGGWVALRALGVPRGAAAAALIALGSVPWVLAWQSNGSITDPPALAWLLVCAALCVLARGRTVLLGPAILAAALSIGTKTTVLPVVAVVLGAGLWTCRDALRPCLRALAFATAVGVLIGGGWYLRNLIDHGSPFWPIVAAPWGDPLPASVEAVKTSFLSRPGPTVDGLGSLYVHRFGGGWLLLAAGILAPIACASRRVVIAAVATAAGLLLWALSPVTGLPPDGTFPETIFSTTRYLLPVLAVACTALALAAAGARPWRRRATVAVLAGIAALNAVELFHYYGFPSVPSALVPVTGAVAGAIGAFALGWVRIGARAAPRGALAVATIAAGALLAVPASGFLGRHAGTHSVPVWPIEHYLASQPSFRAGASPVAITPTYVGPLAGDRLRHRLLAIGADESCPRIRSRARREWLVVFGGPLGGPGPAHAASCLKGRAPGFRFGFGAVYGPPLG
jgi:hypothetical protein